MPRDGFSTKARLAVFASLASGLVLSSASAQAPPGHAWKTYGNSRYGYSICYPADLLRPQAEPDAHDGVIFNAPSGVTMSVSGEIASPSHLDETLSLIVSTLHGRPTYHAKGADWRVASGTADGRVFYSRVIAAEGVVAQFILVYPRAAGRVYAPVIRRINACMKIG